MGRTLVEHSKRKRLTPAERENQILREAYGQAEEKGLTKFTRVSVAEACGVTDGLVSRYFGTLRGLQEAVVVEARARDNARLIADAVANGFT